MMERTMYIPLTEKRLLTVKECIDCSTTEIYARADTEMERKAMEASYQDILPKEVLSSWKDDGNLMSFLESLCK